jgi:class 3 adenylate cyclase
VDGIQDLRDDQGRLAYTVRGSGPPLVFVPDLFIPIEALDEDPPFAQFLDGLASFATLILVDRQGVGFSDPIADWARPIFDTWAEDLARVIRGVVGGPATVLGTGIQSGLSALRMAQTAPELVARLVLLNVATVSQTSGPSEELLRNIDGESEFDFGSMVAPSRIGDVAYGRWIERAGRRGASPADARRMWEAILATDVDRLDTIAVPTTMLLRTGMAWKDALDGARAMVEAIPGAELIELSGADVYPNCGDVDEVVHAIGEAMGAASVRSSGPALLTLLFSDIVASTERSGEIGNARWRGVLDIHDEVVTKVVTRHAGTVVKHTGDGVLATFAMPSRGLRAARALRDELARSGLDVRIGLHTAEVEQRGSDVNGVGVNLAARIMDCAVGGEILVSAAVPSIVAGADFSFASRGAFALKGVAGNQELFELV